MSAWDFWRSTWQLCETEPGPDDLTGRFWTGGDGTVIVVLRELKDGSLYADHLDLARVEGNPNP